MKFREAFECTIIVQLYFHLKSCCLITSKQSIPDQAVVLHISKSHIYYTYDISHNIIVYPPPSYHWLQTNIHTLIRTSLPEETLSSHSKWLCTRIDQTSCRTVPALLITQTSSLSLPIMNFQFTCFVLQLPKLNVLSVLR